MSKLPYGRHAIDEDDIAAVVDVLRGDWLTTGPAVDAFEADLRGATGAPHAIAVANGTAALHLACLALGIGPGDRVIVPAITFVATANAARMTGADVTFADVDPETGLMTGETLLNALQSAEGDVKAVFVVHLAGQPVDLEAISDICRARGIALVEDACHALGGTYKSTKIGACAYSDIATFSFHAVKTITMCEGGAVTTASPKIAAQIRALRQHGFGAKASSLSNIDMPPDLARHMSHLGYNYRASDVQCALGASQLKKLPQFKAKRAELIEAYAVHLAQLDLGIRLNPIKVETDPCWHLAALQLDFQALGASRKYVMEGLRACGIGTQVHYQPVPDQPYYRGLDGTQKSSQDFSGADLYFRRTLSVPLHTGMDVEDVPRVCNALGDVISTAQRRASDGRHKAPKTRESKQCA